MSTPQVPPRPDPSRATEASSRALVWTTVGVNALLGLFTLTGWIDRQHPCRTSCSWQPAGGMLWVILAILDVGLLLVWAGVGYIRLIAVGERIGHRILGRDEGETDDH